MDRIPIQPLDAHDDWLRKSRTASTTVSITESDEFLLSDAELSFDVRLSSPEGYFSDFEDDPFSLPSSAVGRLLGQVDGCDDDRPSYDDFDDRPLEDGHGNSESEINERSLVDDVFIHTQDLTSHQSTLVSLPSNTSLPSTSLPSNASLPSIASLNATSGYVSSPMVDADALRDVERPLDCLDVQCPVNLVGDLLFGGQVIGGSLGDVSQTESDIANENEDNVGDVNPCSQDLSQDDGSRDSFFSCLSSQVLDDREGEIDGLPGSTVPGMDRIRSFVEDQGPMGHRRPSEHQQADVRVSFRCQLCLEVFSSVTEFYKHNLLSHLQMQCRFCQGRFRSNFQLNRHIKICHSKAVYRRRKECKHRLKNYRCPLCGEKFRFRTNMKLHGRKDHKRP